VLYVTLEHLKRLEGEVLNALDELGDRQTGLALGGERADAAAGETVDPHNLLGIELNPRAAAIAEVVLWIGYLQWHFRTRGDVNPPVPVIRDFRNIENRDAVLAYDDVQLVVDERGVPVSRWYGETMKISRITGEKIPDETARKAVERYLNPRKAAWPEADFVVGNPPFIGASTMRAALGDGYVEALRDAWPDVPESADLVMYWWHHAALLTRRGALARFGLITTNSIRQAFNRRVIEAALLPSPVGRGAGGEGTTKRETASADVPSSGAARHLLPVGEGKSQPLSPASASALLPSPTGRGAGGEGESRRRLPKAPLPQETIAFARTLRREQTDAETLMWMLLRDRRLHGMKFRRQHPVPPYTLDFYCHPLRLAVELDGSQHLDSARDQARDAALNDAGIEVLRYWNHDVLARTEQVLDDLWNRIDHRSDVIAGGTAAAEPSPPAPLPVGEGSAMSRDEAKRAFDDAVLERLVALNAERAAEEARGLVRWLRPEFQNPQAAPAQTVIDTGPEDDTPEAVAPLAAAKPQPWPKDAVAQVRAVADVLSTSPQALSLDDIAARGKTRAAFARWAERVAPERRSGRPRVRLTSREVNPTI
jgi:very-short-patch-repair endonuclease